MIGGGLAAGATVDPKQVVREAASKGGIASQAGVAKGVGYAEPVSGPYVRDPVDELMTSLWDHSNAVDIALNRMPAHIAGKKSWSPSFKQSEAYKEAMEEIQARRNLERNRSFAEKVAKKLGFG